MLAQVPLGPDGWPNLILQGSSFTLLAILVVYIGPKVLSELKAERESRDVRFENLIMSLQQKWEERNGNIVAAIHTQTDSWREEIRAHTAAIKEFGRTICRYPNKGGN